ncbi:MAG: hypothetical protein NTU97_03155 [Candidatus Magasanikbacteria bacterium]|nr:hypothetical protein [Candidatus Magasanikbacteria bacterium]
MRFIFHLLGIIFFVIWIAIGGVALFGVLTLAKTQPWQMLSSINLGGLTNTVGSVGNIADVVQKIQANKGDAAAAYNSLSTTQQDCLKKELGSQTITDVLAGKQIQPTPDLILKAMKCVK